MIRAVKVSLVVLGLTAVFQLIVVGFSGSVAAAVLCGYPRLSGHEELHR